MPLARFWTVSASIVGVLAVAVYIESEILQTSTIPTSYAYVNIIFYAALLPLIVYYAVQFAKIMGAESTVRRLLLLGAVLWIVRLFGNIDLTGGVGSPNYSNLPLHLINAGVFSTLSY